MGKVSVWLLANYGPNAAAVAGSYRRRLDDNSTDAKAIMEDLRRVCSIYETTATLDGQGRVDPIAMAVNEGRRQAFQHIASVLGVTEDELKPEKDRTDDRDSERGPDRGDTGSAPRPRFGHDASDNT